MRAEPPIAARLPRWLVMPGVAAGLGWAIVYAVVWLSGQRFSTAYLGYGWQLVPWDVLSADPLSSVWFLHIQPPLWNLALGLPAWLSPFSDAGTLQVLMFAIGVANAVLAALVAERLGVRRRWATLVALVATVHPEVLKLAFEPTYELAVSALLLALLWAAARLADSGTRSAADARPGRWLLAVSAVGTATVLTRSLYHPVWLVVVLAVCWWALRGRVTWRTVGLAALVPLVLVGGWMAKNQVLFDRPTLSSWFGMNLQRAVVPVLDLDDLQRMHADGSVSDIAIIGPFGKYELYADVMPPCAPTRSHRALAEPDRTTDLYSPNFNYECFLPVFDQAGEDAWAVIREHPEAFLEGRLWSLRTTFAVAETPPRSPSAVMRAIDSVYSVLRVDYRGALSTEGWGSPIYGELVAPTDFALVPIFMYAGTALAGMWHAWLLARRRAGDIGRSLVLVLGGFTVVWTVGVGAVAELGEQARFRTMVDTVVWVISLSAAIVFIARRTRSASGGT